MQIEVNDKSYSVVKLLGKGKGGYSYLVESNGEQFVLKQLHHEKCPYYTFGNKFESELSAYNFLIELGIKVPKLIDTDKDKEILIKEFIDGDTIDKFVLDDKMNDDFYNQIKTYQSICKVNNINLDYFPTNFVVNSNNELFYVDYECNEYSDEWNFENWGIKYWKKTDDFYDYFSYKTKQLETPHLTLRKLRRSDAFDIFNNYANDSEVTKFLTWDVHSSIEVTQKLVDSWFEEYKNNKNSYKWFIKDKETAKVIGSIDIVKYIDGNPELGYVLSRSFWGKGYMSEACKAVCDYLFEEGFNKIYISAMVENIGSQKVALKNGFKFLKESTFAFNKGGKDRVEKVFYYVLDKTNC